MDTLTDNQLIDRYLRGDDKSFEVLVARYADAIHRFVLRYVQSQEQAEDVTQEVFLKVWRNAKKVDRSKSFKSWLYTIAKNTALDLLKKKKSTPFSAFESETGRNFIVETLPSKGHQPITLAEIQEHQGMFLQAMELLSEKYQTILRMYYYEYLNFREIAERLQEPLNTIKSRHRRGLVLLRKSIRETI